MKTEIDKGHIVLSVKFLPVSSYGFMETYCETGVLECKFPKAGTLPSIHQYSVVKIVLYR